MVHLKAVTDHVALAPKGASATHAALGAMAAWCFKRIPGAPNSFHRFSIGFHMFSIGFHMFSIGFHRFSIGFHMLSNRF